MGIITEVQYGKVIYRTEKQEYKHLFEKTESKPRGILIK